MFYTTGSTSVATLNFRRIMTVSKRLENPEAGQMKSIQKKRLKIIFRGNRKPGRAVLNNRIKKGLFSCFIVMTKRLQAGVTLMKEHFKMCMPGS